jgi:rhotekin
LFSLFADNRTQELPLFGHFCCRLAAQPDCMTKELICGEVSLRRGSKADFVPAFLSLKGFKLSVWASRETSADLEPYYSLPIDKVRSFILSRSPVTDFWFDLQEASVQIGDNKQVHVVRLEEGKEVTLTIQSKSAEEQQQWLAHLMKSAQDHAR